MILTVQSLKYLLNAGVGGAGHQVFERRRERRHAGDAECGCFPASQAGSRGWCECFVDVHKTTIAVSEFLRQISRSETMTLQDIMML